MTLDGLERIIRNAVLRRSRVNFVRYADDCVPRTHQRMNFRKVRCCTKDEGRPLGADLQEQASNAWVKSPCSER
jgi:hypothetical protein